MKKYAKLQMHSNAGQLVTIACVLQRAVDGISNMIMNEYWLSIPESYYTINTDRPISATIYPIFMCN